jgi:hypothetical protein
LPATPFIISSGSTIFLELQHSWLLWLTCSDQARRTFSRRPRPKDTVDTSTAHFRANATRVHCGTHSLVPLPHYDLHHRHSNAVLTSCLGSSQSRRLPQRSGGFLDVSSRNHVLLTRLLPILPSPRANPKTTPPTRSPPPPLPQGKIPLPTYDLIHCLLQASRSGSKRREAPSSP